MNKRTLTVGSLIPKNLVADKVFRPHSSYMEDINHTEGQKLNNKITLSQNEMRFEIQPVQGNLLDIALDQGQTLQYKCQKGTCGVCTVKVAEGASYLSLPNEKEQKKLKSALDVGYRLACQAEVL
ncbi:2Fe-2S iron-sulfur cluster-binding protein [Priestia abyssalis]|uniref:2Fe-2S iron-sulfur cluster-binding protein n=1 Tax=Priestia abyssalis TaxID=1221450 RepID=UPI00147284D6|nr:2Fe-2S iron-sulfur cluster-binding protein [Priestia abyssalis]